MIWLGVETSSPEGSLALGDGTKILHEIRWSRETEGKGSHSERITGEFEKLIALSGAELSRIERIAVSVGPGSFTGLRVGVNFAKSLAYALSRPLVAVNSLHIATSGLAPRGRPLVAMTNAFRNMVFLARYECRDGWQETSPPRVATLDQLADLIRGPHDCIGGGWTEYGHFLPPELKALIHWRAEHTLHPSASQLLHLIAQRPDLASRTMDWKTLTPLYLRSSAAEEKMTQKD